MVDVRDVQLPASPGAPRMPPRGTILEPYIALFNGRYGLAAVAAGAFVFLVGLLLAATIGFEQEYLATPAIYLGTCAIVWTAWWVGWATRRVRVLVERVQPAFLVGHERFGAEVARYERVVGNHRAQLQCALTLWAINCIDLYFRSRSTSGLLIFAPEWSNAPDLIVKNLILAFYSLFAFVLVVASAAGVFGYLMFVRRATRLPLVPSLPLARAKLRGLTHFSIATGLAWSIGISFVVALFQLQLRPQAVASVLVFSAIGLAVLVLPEWTIHDALERLRHDLLDRAIVRLRTGVTRRDADAGAIESLPPDVQAVVDARTWTFDFANVSSALATWLLPLVPLAVNSIVP